VGSFLDARRHGGRWLVRMEDLDRERCLPGCAPQILATLEALGLAWDGRVEYQSERTARYLEALQRLTSRELTFECSCSRRELTVEPYPGTCRSGPAHPGPTATRFRVDPGASISFDDRLQGAQHVALATLGDVVIRRRDGAFAYQLAVVVDDHEQGVSDVVRGADLLPSTGWQLALQHALGLPSPRYAHLPVVVDGEHGKLSKSRRSLALAHARPGAQLCTALCLLGLKPPSQLADARPETVLDWAREHWEIQALKGVQQVTAP